MKTKTRKLAEDRLAETAKLYADGDAIVEKLSAQKVITGNQIAEHGRRVQALVASYHWDICDKSARAVLLNAHPHTRSCAEISAMDEAQCRPKPVRQKRTSYL